ncbi:hypothetical protein [Helicobacter labacensis]|uniref:hypothetical protein n=1 Tax=Helicobacter labacensis TaxID=2316079 RepID=UPI000EAB7FDA|nr:hypothetical protein [Helicobacter labacensis]
MPKVESLKRKLLEIDKRARITCIHQPVSVHTDMDLWIQEADFLINTLNEPYIGYTSAKISKVLL